MRKTSLLLAMLLLAKPAYAAHLSDMIGVWKTDDADGRVEIYDCGDGTPCGRLTNVTDPSFTDDFNPDPDLRGRHLQGVIILDGFKAKRRSFTGGEIYNPGNGKSYRSALALTADDQFQVKGCVFLFCQSQYWQRAE